MKLIEEIEGKDGKYVVEFTVTEFLRLSSAVSYFNHFWNDIDDSALEATEKDFEKLDNDFIQILRQKARDEE